jgi:hypothetical protein
MYRTVMRASIAYAAQIEIKPSASHVDYFIASHKNRSQESQHAGSCAQ